MKRIAAKIKKKVLIEYLYLDLQSCERCMSTDKVLDSVVELLRPVLDAAGYRIEYRKILVEDEASAEAYRFLSSPTILLNGEDVFGDILENDCGCCSTISGTDVKCRAFLDGDKLVDAPNKAMLINAILKKLYGPSPEPEKPYVLPENLKNFFEGKRNKKGSNLK